jgi:hypothetical protein
MSCAIFTLLGLYVAVANKGNDWIVRAIFAIAVALLFVACFMAWRDEYRKRIALEKSLAWDEPSLKQQTLALSQSVLDFFYSRSENAPVETGSAPFFIGASGEEMLKQTVDANRKRRAHAAFESETLEVYRYKYARQVCTCVSKLKDKGVQEDWMEGYWDNPGNSATIKVIGEQLGKMSDLVADEDKGITKIH